MAASPVASLADSTVATPITIHSTANVNVTAAGHADYLLVKGKQSQKNARLGRSGSVTWHFTVDDPRS